MNRIFERVLIAVLTAAAELLIDEVTTQKGDKKAGRKPVSKKK